MSGPRRSFIFSIAVTLSLGLAVLPRRAEARKYTLPELLERVVAQYPGIVAAKENQHASEAQVSQANRLWFPTGGVTFGITGSPDVKCADSSGFVNPDKAVRETNCVRTNINATRIGSGNIGEILPIHGVALNFNATLIQPLYTSGKIEYARAAAGAGLDVSKNQVEAAKNEAKLWAVRAYFGVKWARAAKETIDDGRSKVSDWLKRIDKEIEKGKSVYSESDLIRLKIAADAADLVSLDAGRGLEFALAGIRYLAGDPEADVDDADFDDELVEQPLSYYQDAARTHRPEARMLDAGKQGYKALRKLKISEMLPDIGLVTSFSYGLATGVDNPNNSFMNQANYLGANLALAVRMPLDIALRLGRYDEARAQEKSFEARREQALGGIGLEIRKAWLDAAEAKGRRVVLRHSEKIARGWYNATDQALQTGVADARDVAESARAYVELRLRHLQALMDQNVSLAVLRNTAGLL